MSNLFKSKQFVEIEAGLACKLGGIQICILLYQVISWEWAHSEVVTEVRRRERAVGRISVENEIIHLALV